MLTQFHSILALACHIAGLLILIYGALLLIMAVARGGDALGFVKGGALILLGGWFADLAG